MYLLVQHEINSQRDPKSAGSLDEMEMEEPGYTTECLCLVGLRTEVRGKETNLLFPYVKEVNILEICGGWSPFFLFIFLFRARPSAYGSSRIGVKSDLQLQAYTQPQQCGM